MTSVAARTATTPAPATVQLSVLLWLGAIGAGAAEALVHLLSTEPPTLTQLAARFGIYAVLTVLVLALHTGRDAVRWTVAVLLGGFGTASLVIEPVSWLLTGGSPGLFLVTADDARARRRRPAHRAPRGGVLRAGADVPPHCERLVPPPLTGRAAAHAVAWPARVSPHRSVRSARCRVGPMLPIGSPIRRDTSA